MKKIVLLDSLAIIHRAYHALPNFSTRSGKPTGALYGVSTMLISIIKELKPDYVLACFDVSKPTFRHEAFDDYKKGRKKTEDDLLIQIQESKEIFEAFGIEILEKEGYEADDIIGTLVEKLKKEDLKIFIASGDMDTFQLIDDDRVVVYTLKKADQSVIYNEKEVIKKFGFEPKYIVDYKALAGDSSDNIPGISGIGVKTATNLILNFGDLENIYNILNKNEKEFIDKFKIGKITPRIIKLLKEGEEEAFFSKELATIKRDLNIDFDFSRQKSFLENIDLSKTGEVFRKFEFRHLNERLEKILGREDKIKEEKYKDIEDKDWEKIEKLKLAISLLNPNISSPTIDDILNFGKTFKEAEENIKKEIKKFKLDFVWKEIEIPLIPIVKKMKERGFKIDKEKIHIFSDLFKRKINEIEKKVFKISGKEFNLKSTQQLSEVLFNDLKLSVKGLKKTPKGVISTKESELVKLKGEHEIIDLILEHRELSKMISTYLDNFLNLIDEKNRIHPDYYQVGTATGRMTSKNPSIQNIPVGGEYGQKIREIFISEEGFSLFSFDYSQIELRVAAILSGDEKLMNLFIEGKDIHEAVAVEIFGDNSPANRRKAKAINFGILYGMGASSLRKSLSEGLEGEISMAEARKYLDDYFEKFKTLADFLKKTKDFVKEKGYSETLFGRKRFFPEINSKQAFIRSMAERMAINAPIQGSATGDIIKLAMVKINNFLVENKMENKVWFLAQVHDELIFEIDDKVDEKIILNIKEIMENILIDLKIDDNYKKVPLVVEFSKGKNWAELKK